MASTISVPAGRDASLLFSCRLVAISSTESGRGTGEDAPAGGMMTGEGVAIWGSEVSTALLMSLKILSPHT